MKMSPRNGKLFRCFWNWRWKNILIRRKTTIFLIIDFFLKENFYFRIFLSFPICFENDYIILIKFLFIHFFSLKCTNWFWVRPLTAFRFYTTLMSCQKMLILSFISRVKRFSSFHLKLFLQLSGQSLFKMEIS